MRALGPRSQLILFAAAVLVPCAVLIALSLRIVGQDRELQVKRRADERHQVAVRARETLLAALETIRVGEATGDLAPGQSYRYPETVFVGWIEEGRLALPWEAEHDQAVRRNRELIAKPPFDAAIRACSPASADCYERAASAAARIPSRPPMPAGCRPRRWTPPASPRAPLRCSARCSIRRRKSPIRMGSRWASTPLSPSCRGARRIRGSFPKCRQPSPRGRGSRRSPRSWSPRSPGNCRRPPDCGAARMPWSVCSSRPKPCRTIFRACARCGMAAPGRHGSPMARISGCSVRQGIRRRARPSLPCAARTCSAVPRRRGPALPIPASPAGNRWGKRSPA